MGPGVDRGSARPAGRYAAPAAGGRHVRGLRAPREEPEPHDDGLRAYPVGPGAAGGPRPLHLERSTRASARCSDRGPGSGPAPGLRDVPPDGAWAETSRADPPLPLSPSRAAVGGGDSIAAHRRGSMGHGAPLALRRYGGELAADPPEEERRGGVREPKRGGRGQLAAARHHPRVLSDQDPAPEPGSRERARAPALRGYRSQPPTDPDPRNGPSQAAVLRPVPPWTATHQPWAGPCRPELCWNGGGGGPRPRQRGEDPPRTAMARRPAPGPRAPGPGARPGEAGPRRRGATTA